MILITNKKWSSQLTYLGGEVKPGGKLHLCLAADGADPYEFRPDILYWEDGKRFAWLAKTGVSRVFDGEHFFELTDLGGGRGELG